MHVVDCIWTRNSDWLKLSLFLCALNNCVRHIYDNISQVVTTILSRNRLNDDGDGISDPVTVYIMSFFSFIVKTSRIRRIKGTTDRCYDYCAASTCFYNFFYYCLYVLHYIYRHRRWIMLIWTWNVVWSRCWCRRVVIRILKK